MSTYLAQGVVLRRRDYREYDRLVTIFSDVDGKIEAVARGVRKPKSKLAGHLEPFSYASFMFATGRVFDVLASSVKLSSFRIPQTDLVSFALASYFFEAVDRLTRPRQADEDLFRLLINFLSTLESDLDPHGGSPVFQRVLMMEFFLFQLLQHLGFAPSLDRCVVGRERLGREDFHLSVRHGGLVCDEHRPKQDASRPLGPQTIEVLRLMNDGHLEAVRFMNRSDATLREVAAAMSDFLTDHLGEPLATKAFLSQVLQPS